MEKYVEEENKEITQKFNDIAYDIGKLLISLSTGIVVLSLSLQKDVLGNTIDFKYLLFLGWGIEILSILVGVLFCYSFLMFYHIWETIESYHWITVALGLVHFITFISGLILLTLFTTLNLF